MKYNLINVSNADASLDAKKADKSTVASQFATVAKASDASNLVGSLNSKVDNNSASEAKSFTAINGNVSSLSNSANTNYTKLSKTINNLDVTDEKINALRNLMHAGGETVPKLMAMATSYEAEIGSNSDEGNSLASAKEDKATAANSFNSLQSSAATHADSETNSAVNSAKNQFATVNTSVEANKNAIGSMSTKITSLTNANADLTNAVHQLLSALSSNPTTNK